MKKTRRVFAMVMLGMATLAASVSGQFRHTGKNKQHLALIGTYTTKTNSKGIYSVRFNEETGKWSGVEVAAAAAVDPSFVAIHPNGKFVYAVNEMGEYEGKKSGAITAYRLDEATGKLSELNQLASLGTGPCYIALDKTAKFVLVANYDGGSVAAFPILDDGMLGASSGFAQHSGRGTVKERQDSAHAHWIETSPDNRFAIVADLGLDEVLIYRFDAATGALTPNDPPFLKLSSGAGPRHMAFHPNHRVAYVLNELQSTITAMQFDAEHGTLSPVQTIGTLPSTFSGPNDAAEIVVHPNGKFLYSSNRGHDSIAIFGIDPRVGELTSLGTASTRGKTPRNFVIDPSGKFLIVANQESDDLAVFRIDGKSGELSFTHETLQVPAPVDIAFVPAQ